MKIFEAYLFAMFVLSLWLIAAEARVILCDPPADFIDDFMGRVVGAFGLFFLGDRDVRCENPRRT